MRSSLRLLDDALIERILAEARDLLGTLGVEIHNPGVLDLLGQHGARVDGAAARAWLPADLLVAGVAIIGGCCGTTPEHVRALRAVVDARAR